MDKYKFSTLSDQQHRSIMDAIKSAGRNIEIRLGTSVKDAEAIAGYINGLEALSFITPWERDAYLKVLKKTVKSAGAIFEPKHDDTLAGCILQSRAEAEGKNNGT